MGNPDHPQDIVLRPIGVIHSPHKKLEETPVQPAFAEGVKAQVEVFAEYHEGLRDLEGYSHIFLIYHFHQAPAPKLTVTPYLQDTPRGLFATRAPCRPNPIGLSLVRLLKIENGVLHIEDVDVLDGTPLLDIKPYVSRFDSCDGARCGWQDQVDDSTASARGRRRFRGSGQSRQG
ncbi:MAG: tRNA-Thr(GGU) m(6)t(6)A37 methyltransferase TsaA [Gemmatimonas sp. SM23_52]|nr:MAG: tRNA-Thr(GGU) m(6)t(6)A37 methyltransferase TsaA [Gemmatimonas sp. SM23_52]